MGFKESSLNEVKEYLNKDYEKELNKLFPNHKVSELCYNILSMEQIQALGFQDFFSPDRMRDNQDKQERLLNMSMEEFLEEKSNERKKKWEDGKLSFYIVITKDAADAFQYYDNDNESVMVYDQKISNKYPTFHDEDLKESDRQEK